MKRIKFTVYLMLVFAMMALIPSQAKAEQKFEFYYQIVTGAEDLGTAPEEGDGWLSKIKKGVKKGINAGKRLWEGNVTRVSGLDEGEHRWYSERDHNVAYNVKRVKVESEEHLMELMGVSSVDEMTNGQKALFEVYHSSKSDAIKERAQYAYHDKINVLLTDTTGTDIKYTDSKGNEVSVDPSNFSKDFWSWSNGTTIHMASHNYKGSNSVADARSTFLHEYCHSIDKTVKEFFNPYGKDGSHYGAEMSDNRAAFVEGWAEYNEMLESEAEAQDKINNTKKVMIELSDEEGAIAKEDPNRKTYDNGISVYEYVDPSTLSASQLMKCEAYNATIMYRIATEVPGGREMIYDAFTGTRWNLFRSLKTIIKKLCKENPDAIGQVGQILDEMTYGKMSDKEIKKYLGKSDETNAFLKDRAEGYPEEQKEEQTEPEKVETDDQPIDGASQETNNLFNIK